MSKNLFSTAARRMAVLLLMLCLSATTTWALRITCVTVPNNSIKGGKASLYDTYNYPRRVHVKTNPGFVVKSVVWEKKENGEVTSRKTLHKISSKTTTRDEYYDVPEVTGCYLTVTFRQLSDNVEVNFDINFPDVEGPEKQNLKIGNHVTRPADPTDNYFNFLGWFTDEKFKNAFDFSNALDYTLPYVLDEDKLILNLYAKWEAKWSWKFDTEEKKALRIMGPGPMDDYKTGKAPWYKDAKTINTIYIEDDVTHIGNYAFQYLKLVTSDITIPTSVKSIGCCAFSCLSSQVLNISIATTAESQLDSLDQNAFVSAKAHIDLSKSALLKKIGKDAFSKTQGDVTLPASIDTIAPNAFSNFKGSHVYIPVPDGKILTLNGIGYSGEITNGKADIASYLFPKYPKIKNSTAIKFKIVNPSDYDKVTVTFNANGHGTAPASVETTIGQTISQPAALTADGYTFLGWYKDEGCTEAFDFSTMLSRTGLIFNDIKECFILNLYAKWQKNSCTVTFNGNGSTDGEMADVTHDGGTSFTIPDCAFTFTDHPFLGWSTSSKGNVEYQPGDVTPLLQHDLTLYAVWKYEKTGSCGTDLTWTLTSSTASGEYDKLTISGSGAMSDFDNSENNYCAPWDGYSYSIKTLIIEEGVTHIGNVAFYDLSEVTSDITIPASVESIGDNAFSYVSSSKNNAGISITTAKDSKLSIINEYVFEYANAHIDLSNSTQLTNIEYYTFNKVTKDVVLPSSVISIHENAFINFTGDYVNISVLNDKVITVNGDVYDAANLNDDRQADITSYLFDDLGNRRKSNKVTLAQVKYPMITFTVTTDEHCEAYYYQDITEATGVHPGETVVLSWSGDDLEEGTYVSGFTITKEHGGTVEVKPCDNSQDYYFIMPEDNVSVKTHTAPRETYTLDLTSAVKRPIVINRMVFILMQTLVGYLHAEEDLKTGRYLQCYDVNFDGKYDFELTMPAADDDDVDPDDIYAYDYTVRLLAGASSVTTNHLFTPVYPVPYKYNKILVKFTNSEVTQNQIMFDDLYDRDDLNFDLLCDWSNTTHNLIIDGRKLYRDGDWNTICLPFDLTLAGSSFDFGEDEDSDERNLEARQLTAASITDKTLNLTFSEPVTTLQAGVPYIIKWSNAPRNIENPLFLNATIANVAACAGSTNEEKVATFLTSNGYDNGVAGEDRVRFTGTFGWTSFSKTDTSILFLGAANKLYYPEPSYDEKTGIVSTPTLGAFRAYFKLGDDASQAREITNFNLLFDDGSEETGIADGRSRMEDGRCDAWYTVNGVKLNSQPTQKGLYIYKGRKVAIK